MPVKARKITFKSDRVEILVEVNCVFTKEVRLKIADSVSSRFPGILEHACRNSHGPRFGDCINTTSLAHTLEHIIIWHLQNSSDLNIGHNTHSLQCVKEQAEDVCLSSNLARDEMLLKVDKSDLQNMSDLKTEFSTNNLPCASKIKKEQGLTEDFNKNKNDLCDTAPYLQNMSDFKDYLQKFQEITASKRQDGEDQDRNVGERIYVGKTVKVAPDLAKIELKYYDDIRALRAINCSISALNKIIETCSD